MVSVTVGGRSCRDVAGIRIGAKVATVAAASAVVAGGAVGVATVVSNDDVGAEYPSDVRLEPSEQDGVDAFPLGAPGPLQVDLGAPVELDSAAADAYFGNYEGGEVEERRVSVSYEGATYDLGPVVVPVEFPGDFVERNAGTRRLTSVILDDVAFVSTGTGAYSPCFYEGTGDTVGGWRYTGEPGSLQVTFLFTSDGKEITDLPMRATFEGPAVVEFDEALVARVIPPDVDINDRCTPLDSAASSWDSGDLAE